VHGLTDKEVTASRKKNGCNSLPPPELDSFWDKLKDNFEDPLIQILCVALGITLVLSFFGYADWLEGIGIGFAVFIATFVSTWSEYKNEESFRQLQLEASRVKNNVFRNGSLQAIFVSEIVVGDCVLLQPGDKLPADGRLLAGEVHITQASLTGENELIRKFVSPEDYVPEEWTVHDNEFLLFRGQVVDVGEGVLIVERVGTNTWYGSMTEELSEKDERKSPLQVKLGKLANDISWVGYIGATLIAISFLFKQFVMDQGWNLHNTLQYLHNWELALNNAVTALILAIIVIVVAVPEGLPMMIAIVLSLNMRKLLKEQVLVRKLLGIETAGSLTLLFCDKTGTITKGAFKPFIFITGSGDSFKSMNEMSDEFVDMLAFSLRESTSSVITPDGAVIGGNSSDRALLSFLNKRQLLDKTDVKVLREVLFSSAHKFSATQLGGDIPKPMLTDTPYISVLKGAAEIVLEKCTHYYDQSGARVPLESLDVVQAEIDRYAKSGARVIAVASTDEPLENCSKSGEDGFVIKDAVLPSTMCLLGVVGISDEIREESAFALQTAREAGIHVIMMTGDRQETAVSIASDVGLLDGERDIVLTSGELNRKSDEEVLEVLSRVAVIARALPTDKSRLVKIAQMGGHVVGMTGDGVNDSTALKKSDVGFAMGSGSEVAKEAADIVIMDDNFKSITRAVLYGRTIFKSIRKFIVFQSTVNVSAMLLAFLGPFIGYDFPLTLIQLLWVNLVMDTLAAIAFGGEAALMSYMKEKPIQKGRNIINGLMWSSILINGLFITFMCNLFLTIPVVPTHFVRDTPALSNRAFLTAFFAYFIFLTNFNAFNVRTNSINIFSGLLLNASFVFIVSVIFGVQMFFTWFGGAILRTIPLTQTEWVVVIIASVVIIPFDMCRKLLVGSFLRDD